MKRIFLKQLIIRNFKGIVEHVIDFSKATAIYGANGIGKSTIYTAFNWLLTGKDEFDRKDYQLKNTVRKELNSQAHVVEGVFDVDGREITLGRSYLEKWTKKKGEAHKTFEGHKTEYFFNNILCNETEYNGHVNDLIPAAIIKLITNPYFFNGLKWDDQRRGLLAIAGKITDDEVIETIATPQNDFGRLINELNNSTTADPLGQLKKELNAKKLALKKAAVEYGPRISEAKRNMPEAENWDALQKEIEKKTAEITGIDAQLTSAAEALNIKQQGLREKQTNLHNLETDLSNIRQKVKTDFMATQGDGNTEITLLEQQISQLQTSIDRLKKIQQNNIDDRARFEKEIEQKRTEVAGYRTKWDAANKEKFVFDDSKCVCPTCNQTLPADDIDAKKIELQNSFNADVLKRKNAFVKESDDLKIQITRLESNIEDIDKDTATGEAITKQSKDMDLLISKLTGLKTAQANKTVVDINAEVDKLMGENQEALDLVGKIFTLKNEIETEKVKPETADNNALIKETKATLTAEVKLLEQKMALKTTIKNTEQRIADLEKDETDNAQAIADLEQQEFEIETFTRAKMDILEKRVNSKFKLVKFRMFETMVNGGIDETCVCEYKGVPYPTLNTAGKLIAGLDVLMTLSEYYQTAAPVFCDCRESVTVIPDSDLQIISLYVSPDDKTIRVEQLK